MYANLWSFCVHKTIRNERQGKEKGECKKQERIGKTSKFLSKYLS